MSPKKNRNPTPSPKAKSIKVEELESRLKKFEEVKACLTREFEKFKEQWVQTDVEWLSLMNISEQTNDTKINNPFRVQQIARFKDAQELNTIPIIVKSDVSVLDKKDFQCEIEVESCDED